MRPLCHKGILDITYLTSKLIFTHIQSWCDLFGYEASKVIGQTCKILQGKDTEMDRIAEIMTGVKVIHNNFFLPFPSLPFVVCHNKASTPIYYIYVIYYCINLKYREAHIFFLVRSP